MGVGVNFGLITSGRDRSDCFHLVEVSGMREAG